MTTAPKFEGITTRADLEAYVNKTVEHHDKTSPGFKAWREQAFQRLVTSRKAWLYAPYNIEVFRTDHWWESTVKFVANWDHIWPVEQDLPIVSFDKPYIVPFSLAHRLRRETFEVPEGRKRRKHVVEDKFKAFELRPDRTAVQKPRIDFCERCGEAQQLLRNMIERRWLQPIHAPYDGLVVEVMLCTGCIASIQQTADALISLAKVRE